ncbi:MAG: PBP1A family penicillin-binding protein [Spirochaetes bacterium]|nr:PBP1A family penicillin-binding protein [Spirochaetota bacterium]
MPKYQGSKTRLPGHGTYRPKKSGGDDLSKKIMDAISSIAWSIASLIKNIPVKKTAASRKPSPAKGGWSFPGLSFIDPVIDFIQSMRYRFGDFKAVILGIAGGMCAAFIVILIIDFYNVRSIANFRPNATTRIYDKNDRLVSELFRQKRDVVTLDKIPKNLVHAFVAIEDNEFYEHWGINPKGIVRAFFINIFSGRIKQGGSTITQQLSKVLLTSGSRNIYRKVKEAFISLMMEFSYSKDEIMGLYLNQIFLGHGAYGVEAASQIYFDKHVWELDLAECALLATLPSAPNKLSPIRYPKRAMQRHMIVLARMVEMGYLTVPQAEAAYLGFWPEYLKRINEMAPTITAWGSRVNKAPWFTEYIRRQLIKKYGEERVYDKGLDVYTTVDIEKQMAGEKILDRALKRQSVESSRLQFRKDEDLTENYSDLVEVISDMFGIAPFARKGSVENERINSYLQENVVEELDGLNFIVGIDPVGQFIGRYEDRFFEDRNFQNVEGCIISINQNNGYIEAIVGGSEFASSNQLNRAMQARRQAGSSIKPLLYSAAMESGKFTPATAVLDSPIVYLDNEGGDWIPENYESEFYGLVRLRKALAMSINVVSIRIADALGIEYVMKYYARLLKMDKSTAKKRIPRNFSIALGSFEITPFELTRAYAIIANGGRDVLPFSIRYIKDRNGKVIENKEEEVRGTIEKMEKDGRIQVLKPETAQLMISMMKGVISGGTGGSASIGRPAAGKTGTTNNWKDAWFVGFTPFVTSGIWIGYDKLGMSLGIGESGGAVAAPVWGQYMREAVKNDPASDFPTYAGLAEKDVCAKSGLLLSSSCRQSISEVFSPSALPSKTCELCSESGSYIEVSRKGPRENISGRQKSAIINNVKKQSSDVLTDDIGSDLLDK